MPRSPAHYRHLGKLALATKAAARAQDLTACHGSAAVQTLAAATSFSH